MFELDSDPIVAIVIRRDAGISVDVLIYLHFKILSWINYGLGPPLSERF